MVEQAVELRDVPVLIGAEQWGDGDEGEIGGAVGDLGRAVDLDLRDIVAALARYVEEDQQRPVRLGFGIIASRQIELRGVIVRGYRATIGIAACRESVCQSVQNCVVAVSLKQKLQ